MSPHVFASVYICWPDFTYERGHVLFLIFFLKLCETSLIFLEKRKKLHFTSKFPCVDEMLGGSGVYCLDLGLRGMLIW